jgi:small subunit ribosomal protein S2
MRQMLDSGVHFGHQTRRWNPKMKRFILTERNGIYIIDLGQTVTYIDQAFAYIKNTVAKGGTILFIGTKKQAQGAVAEQAQRVGMPYVNQRWLGGMLTNFQTVNKRLQRLKELEEMNLEDAASSQFTKKELLMMRRERDKLARTLGGIRNMSKVPSAVWIVDTKKEHLAVDEARKLGLPVVAILDTNADPDEVDYKIPGNDDAIRSVALLTRVIADAVAEGLMARHVAKDADEDAAPAASEPLAEWERELLAVDEGAPVEPAADTAKVVDPTAETPVEGVGIVEVTAPAAAAEAAVGQAQVTEAAAETVGQTPVAEVAPEQAPAETPPAEAAAAVVAPTPPVAEVAPDAAASEPVETVADTPPAEVAPKEAAAAEVVADAPVAEAAVPAVADAPSAPEAAAPKASVADAPPAAAAASKPVADAPPVEAAPGAPAEVVADAAAEAVADAAPEAAPAVKRTRAAKKPAAGTGSKAKPTA